MARTSQKTSAPAIPLDLNEQIRARAYQLYEERGHEDGHDLEDWLAAESELRERQTQKAAA